MYTHLTSQKSVFVADFDFTIVLEDTSYCAHHWKIESTGSNPVDHSTSQCPVQNQRQQNKNLAPKFHFSITAINNKISSQSLISGQNSAVVRNYCYFIRQNIRSESVV